MIRLAETGLKQAAPGNDPAFSCSPWLVEPMHWVKASRWVILGSRLLSRFQS
jgi:hypothetical protein